MDEAALLDLLECPVCLERLDASAKVLPCQHTFCRRCLQGIVTSRAELRCPECRSLVEAGVDELPSNILLVRLLDGIKQRPRRPGGGGAAGGAAANGTTAIASRGPREQGVPGLPLQRVQAKSTLVRGVPQLPCAKALYNYDGKEPGDLKFSKGDIIILRRQVDENWYHGELGGVHGFFPTNFVQIIKPLPQPPPQCKALYDFELKDKEADKDCLPFSKDDILTVIRRVDENWAEGMLGDKIGIFPISYVEFNWAAQQLIEQDKGSEGGEGAGEGASGSGKAGEGKRNTKKRHSFTSLSMSGKASLAPPQRHSMEISGPVLLSSSNPTAAARIGGLSGGLSCSAPSQVHICTTGLIVTPPPSSPITTATVFTFPPESSYGAVPVDGLPPPPPPPPQSSAIGAASSLAPGQRPSPTTSDPSGRQRPTVYVAMFPYCPRKEDELELRKGEMFLVLERCQDGWFKGTSMHTGKIGVFPGNYMSPISRTGAGCAQAKLPLPLGSQAGRGVTILTPSSPLGVPVGGADPSKPLPPCPLPTAVVPGQPAKVLLHMTGQMTVNQARNAARTASCLSQDRPTAAVLPIQAQGPAAYLPHLPVPAPGPVRPGVALCSAAASLTPPNVSAASLATPSAGSAPLEGETTMRPMAVPIASGNTTPISPGSTTPITPGNTVPIAPGSSAPAVCRLDKKEKKGLLKLLSTKKRPRPSPPSSPTLESEQAAVAVAIGGEGLQGAVGPELPAPVTGGNHSRTGPCPAEADSSSSSSALPCADPSFRRSGLLDIAVPIAPPPRQPCSSLLSLQQDARPIICERYRVVVSYPPQSEAELELKEGDIVFVHKKREDGWFKGTLQRNGRTGLFPGSFVLSI
ncbi:E3 ubiquitin-protein ligase SH3RF1 [Anguilla rostrata]|uniref:E3 ubiquitin-protein ligase SH3RF1 n=1 Tax=Anguilla rostrata TaxID=7938 RepID=UPI0030CB6C0C